MNQISLQVPEVHCDHCKTSIEGAVSQLEGISKVDVVISDATVNIEFDGSSVEVDKIKSTIEDQGYAVFG